MIDVHELLHLKEDQLARVRKEIDALRLVAPLVTEPDRSQDLPSDADPQAASAWLEDFGHPQNALEESSSESPLHPMGPKRSRLRDWLGRAVGE